MGALLFFSAIIAVLVAFDYAALRWGADSRLDTHGEPDLPGLE
jgi:hypothetical protein